MHFLPRALCCLTPIKIKRNFAGNQHDVISWYLIMLHTHVVAVHGSLVSNNWNRNPSLPPWGIWYHEMAIEWSLATRLNVHETASGGVDLALRLWWKWPSAAGLYFDHWPSWKGWRVMVKVEGWQIHCACMRLSDTNPPCLHRWDFLVSMEYYVETMLHFWISCKLYLISGFRCMKTIITDDPLDKLSRWWFQILFYFHPYLCNFQNTRWFKPFMGDNYVKKWSKLCVAMGPLQKRYPPFWMFMFTLQKHAGVG